MVPPSANTHTAQEISTFPEYHDDINDDDNNTTKPEDNNFAQTHDEDEDEEKGSPEISKQQRRKRPSLTRLLFRLIRNLCVIFLLAYVGGWASTNYAHNSLREKEDSFRADCAVAGGRIYVRHWRVPGWGVARVDCLHNEGEENRSLEMERGRATVWR
jgi:hypothetical protein